MFKRSVMILLLLVVTSTSTPTFTSLPLRIMIPIVVITCTSTSHRCVSGPSVRRRERRTGTASVPRRPSGDVPTGIRVADFDVSYCNPWSSCFDVIPHSVRILCTIRRGVGRRVTESFPWRCQAAAGTKHEDFWSCAGDGPPQHERSTTPLLRLHLRPRSSARPRPRPRP